MLTHGILFLKKLELVIIVILTFSLGDYCICFILTSVAWYFWESTFEAVSLLISSRVKRKFFWMYLAFSSNESLISLIAHFRMSMFFLCSTLPLSYWWKTSQFVGFIFLSSIHRIHYHNINPNWKWVSFNNLYPEYIAKGTI